MTCVCWTLVVFLFILTQQYITYHSVRGEHNRRHYWCRCPHDHRELRLWFIPQWVSKFSYEPLAWIILSMLSSECWYCCDCFVVESYSWTHSRHRVRWAVSNWCPGLWAASSAVWPGHCYSPWHPRGTCAQTHCERFHETTLYAPDLSLLCTTMWLHCGQQAGCLSNLL